MRRFRFGPILAKRPPLAPGDVVILLAMAALLGVGARLAFAAPRVVRGPEIVLAARALPWYALLSVSRMAAAYVLSLVFSIVYGRAAARSRAARAVLMPLLDILQSVPILSYLPVVLLSLAAFLPQALAAEFAAVTLIFTSQAWNMAFSYYQSQTTTPQELREAAAVFRFDGRIRFATLEFPMAAIGLLWNSMMSWSGGWFFLMATEIFVVGDRDFRLPGLGSYLQMAANRGNLRAVGMGIATLVAVIVALDRLIWRPLIAWSDRYKLETVEGDEPPSSRILDLMSRSWIVATVKERVIRPLAERGDARRARAAAEPVRPVDGVEAAYRPSAGAAVAGAVAAAAILWGTVRAASLLTSVPAGEWGRIAAGLAATLVRVAASLGIALLWTIPIGVLIGTSRRVASVVQPLVQVVAAVPATALFPVLVLALLRVPGGLNAAAVLLMLMGTQWYLLFNVIAGAAAIPQDLRFTTALLGLSRVDRWRTLLLPALFPYIVTGAITASGGAWNASVVAEYVEFAGKTYASTGVGAEIAKATASNDHAALLAATLVLSVAVVLINRLFWMRLYRAAEERYRME